MYFSAKTSNNLKDFFSKYLIDKHKNFILCVDVIL